jgi:hypothetical protein
MLLCNLNSGTYVGSSCVKALFYEPTLDSALGIVFADTGWGLKHDFITVNIHCKARNRETHFATSEMHGQTSTTLYNHRRIMPFSDAQRPHTIFQKYPK